MIMMRRFFFFLATSGRGLSIVVRLGVKPVGRTIVFSAFASLFCMGSVSESNGTDRCDEMREHVGSAC